MGVGGPYRGVGRFFGLVGSAPFRSEGSGADGSASHSSASSLWRRLVGSGRDGTDEDVADEGLGGDAVGLEGLASRRVWLSRLMWVAIGLGPVAFVVSLAAFGRDLPDPLPPVPVTVDVNAGVGGWAENFVATWLSADSSQLSAVRQFFPDATRLPPDAADLFVTRTSTIRLDAVAPGFYEVLVSADVLVDLVGDSESFIDGGTRFFTVGVQQLETGFVATSLPGQVPGPPTLAVPNRVLPELSRPDGAAAELATALDGFFGALLTGQGELSRYADLSSGLRPVDPAPFEFVDVAGISAQLEEPGLWLVQVEVLGTADSGSQRLHYAVLVIEGNRWEVAEILPGLPVPSP